MNTSFKQKILAFSTSICLTTSAFSATGVPLFDNLGSLLQGDTEAIAQNAGMVKGERQEGWFSPPPIIENLSKEGEKQMSDTLLWQSSVNYRSHPTLNTYRNGATYSGILDIHAPNIRLKNSFFTEKNGTTEYLNLELHPVQIDDMKLKHINIDFVRVHDNGPSALSPMTISLTTTDKQGNELQPRAVFKVKKDVDKPGYYYKINEKNMANKKNGHAYLKIIYKYPHIDKEFFQTFLIDTFLFSKNQKKNILVEKISLVKENLRKPIPEDSVKRIKVYLSELTHMSPYYNDMVGYNDDVVLDDLTKPGQFTPIRMKEKTNVLNFLTHYPHTVLYKDNVLENYSKKYDSFDYAPYRGYWNKKGALVDKLVQERIFKTKNDGYITEKSLTLKTYTLGGANPGVKEELLEYEKTDNTMISFMSNILEIPNYSKSMFINQWNQMTKSIGLKLGGIMLFDKDKKVTPVDFYQLYYQVQDKDVRNYKNVQYKDSPEFKGYQEYFETLKNVQKVDLSPKENLDLIDHVVKFQEDLYGEDNIISKNLYMLMSFEEYAATWGLTATEAHKLFYFDDVGRMVWKYEGLKDYFAKKTFFDLSFIDFDKNELFSVGKINSEFKSKLPKGADQTKEVKDFFLKNADTLQKFYNTELSNAELIDLYNHKDNLFLAKKIQKLSERQEDNGKKLRKPFGSFYELFVYESCFENTLGYTQGVCASNDIWKKGRKPKPRLGLPLNQPKDYIKVEKKNFNTDLYSGNISRVHYAVKNGANVNAKNGLGMRPIEANIMAAVNEKEGLIIEPALFYYFMKQGSQLDQKFLDYLKEQVRVIERVEGKTVFGFLSNTDSPLVAQIKLIHKNLTDIKNGVKTVNQVVEEDIKDIIKDQNLTWQTKGAVLAIYFQYGMTDRNINDLFEDIGVNVLHLASLNDNKETIQDLISLGADVNKQSNFNTWLPIHFAANSGSKGVMEALIDGGADIDVRLNEKGATPINVAVANGKLPQLKSLVELGAKTDLKYYKNDNSLLAIAIEVGHIHIVDYLVKNGADTKYLNKNGTPVYKFAKKYKMKKYLRKQLGFDF